VKQKFMQQAEAAQIKKKKTEEEAASIERDKRNSQRKWRSKSKAQERQVQDVEVNVRLG